MTRPNKRARELATEREMTKRDWCALSLTLKLQEQIVLYGASSLERFIDAMVEHRHRRKPRRIDR